MKYFFITLTLILVLKTQAQEVYNFELETPSGEHLSFTEIQGTQLTLIDFWATWCKPCVNSIPKLVELSKLYAGNEVAFIGISIDSPRNLSKVLPFVQSVGINYPVLLDTNQELMRELNVSVIPTLLLVSASGQILMVHEGFAPGDAQVIHDAIEHYRHEAK